MFKPGIIVETYHAHRVHEKGYLESLRSYPSDSLVLKVGSNSLGETTIHAYDLNYDYFSIVWEQACDPSSQPHFHSVTTN
jgi:hypothetical protein